MKIVVVAVGAVDTVEIKALSPKPTQNRWAKPCEWENELSKPFTFGDSFPRKEGLRKGPRSVLLCSAAPKMACGLGYPQRFFSTGGGKGGSLYKKYAGAKENFLFQPEAAGGRTVDNLSF